MRIGIDVSRANHEQKTGVEWYCFHLIQEMKKIPLNMFSTPVEFVLYSDRPLEGPLAELPIGWRSKVLSWPPQRFWTQVRLSMEMLVYPPDILFIPAHVFPIIHPAKTVMTVHDVAATKFPDSYNWFERWYSLWSAKRGASKLWKVITPSEFTKRELLQLLGEGAKECEQRITVIPHGVDPVFFEGRNSAEKETILRKYGIQAPFMLSIGRLEEKKNTLRLVQAFERVKHIESGATDWKLVLIGKPGYGYEAVFDALQTSPYRSEIVTPGWVPQADVPAIMQAAEFFVFPSVYEGFGLPVLEAMASGVPVVTSSGMSLEEVGGEEVYYIDPLSVESIADGMRICIRDDPRRRENKQGGKSRAGLFSWKQCAETTLQTLLSSVE